MLSDRSIGAGSVPSRTACRDLKREAEVERTVVRRAPERAWMEWNISLVTATTIDSLGKHV
eukprot:4132225-Pyramimonas_sp.AAC.3